MDYRSDFPNGHLLITPQGLHARLDEPELTVLDVRPTHELVTHGWVPGAAHLDIYGLGVTRTTPEVFGAFTELMRSLFAMRGAAPGRTVVLCDGTSGVRAARGFWLLEYLGHEDVHVLDGGFEAWRAAGLPVSREMAAPRGHSFRPRPRPEIFIGADALRDRLDDPEWVVLDTRSDEEYTGRRVRAARGGAIPGAVHLEWVHYLDDGGRFKPAEALSELFARHGLSRDKPTVPY